MVYRVFAGLRGRSIERILAVASFLALLALFLSPAPRAFSEELPPPENPTYIQTNAAGTDISRGDWYTAAAGGGPGGYQYYAIYVPCGWPTNKPVDIDLYSPEMNQNALGLADEDDNGNINWANPTAANQTTFELYSPGTTFTSYATPGPGAAGSLIQTNYLPSTQPEQWVRFYTIDVAATGCGQYLLRVAASDDDQNGWRLRIGADDDNNPNNTPPPLGYDDADNTPGTGDELIIGMLQTAFQHDNGVLTCLDLYQYVTPSQTSVTFNNFDFDYPGLGTDTTVTYYSPNGRVITGTASGGTAWNNGSNTTRGGDTYTSANAAFASGWWRIRSCVTNHNQYIQEGQLAVPTFYKQPPTPALKIEKTNKSVTRTNGQVDKLRHHDHQHL